MKKLLMTSAILGCLSSPAFALDKGGAFIEPMLTWETGDGDVSLPDPVTNQEVELEGFGAGLRLGFHLFESAFLGVDGRYSMPNFEGTSLNQDADGKAWNYGPVFGLQMPTTLGIRVWGGYIFDATMDPDRSANIDQKFKDGDGWRVGAGIKLGAASLNAEYQDLTYDTTEIESVGVFTTGTNLSNVDLDNKQWIFSVSFPMSI